MKRVNPKVYDTDYYLNVCLGHEAYRRSKGNKLDDKWQKILSKIKVTKDMRVLDLGCGRGEVAIYLAKKGAKVLGIDYSKAAIKLANQSLKKLPSSIQKRIEFKLIDAKNVKLRQSYFDLIISFDVFEHLYKEELEQVMKNLSVVLKRNGILLVHTEANKIYLDYTHHWYTYPVSNLLVKVNNLIYKSKYPGLPGNPRNKYHLIQHVNEPTIFYLKDLFKRYDFKGEIISNSGIIKPFLSWKDLIYNLVVSLYPLSKYFPLNIFFATDYVCIMRNNKK